MEISESDKIYILKFVRSKIKSLFNNESNLTEESHPDSILFSSKSGAFVTLTINGELRGCIGYIIGYKPLIETLADAAVQAAKEDPRFYPLREDEVEQIKIEVSILSEPFKMNSYEDIEIGKHGLILNEQGRRALLLPQVPIEHKMDLEEYLSSLCQKGGFSRNLWREKELNLEAFTAVVFSEDMMEM